MKRFAVAFLLGLAMSLTPNWAHANQPVAPDAPASTYDASSHAFVLPTNGILTSGYGRRGGRMHQGIDIGAPTGTPIVASASGTVIFAGTRSGYGNVIDLRHADGSTTRYAHNSRHLVAVGDTVEQRQEIALVGQTGRATGPHLHFEMHLANHGIVNPMVYLPPRQIQALRNTDSRS